jgi:hypothetical protein
MGLPLEVYENLLTVLLLAGNQTSLLYCGEDRNGEARRPEA